VHNVWWRDTSPVRARPNSISLRAMRVFELGHNPARTAGVRGGPLLRSLWHAPHLRYPVRRRRNSLRSTAAQRHLGSPPMSGRGLIRQRGGSSYTGTGSPLPRNNLSNDHYILRLSNPRFRRRLCPTASIVPLGCVVNSVIERLLLLTEPVPLFLLTWTRRQRAATVIETVAVTRRRTRKRREVWKGEAGE
jgi:hypothetical protein